MAIRRRLTLGQPVQGDDFFPGQLVGGTPARTGSIGGQEASEMPAFGG